MESLLSLSDKGIPIVKDHVADAVQLFLNNLSASRGSRLPFRNRRPARTSVQSFLKRHARQLIYRIPTHQKAKRYAATNRDALKPHFATLEALVEERNVYGSRIWNLDETGGTP